MNEDLLNNGEALSNCNSLSPGKKKGGGGDINEHCPLYFREADEYVSAAVRPLGGGGGGGGGGERVEGGGGGLSGEKFAGSAESRQLRNLGKTNANFLLTLQSRTGGCAAALIKGLITDGDS